MLVGRVRERVERKIRSCLVLQVASCELVRYREDGDGVDRTERELLKMNRWGCGRYKRCRHKILKLEKSGITPSF